jgi:prepilin-type N-terminal cleavage/methylation domain-containing protein
MNRDDVERSVTASGPALARGFTLVELLMVVLVIGVLIGILLPALAGARRNAKKRQAAFEMKAIRTAIVAYYLEHRNWPLPPIELDPATSPREAYTNDNSLILSILTNANPIYIDSAHFRFDASGNIVDPWQAASFPAGRPYVITLDKNRDGSPNQATVTSTSPENN